MTRQREGSKDLSDARRSSRVPSSNRARRQRACSGRTFRIAAVVVGVAVAIGGGFAIGFFVYPHLTSGAQETETDAGLPIDIQTDNDTETIFVDSGGNSSLATDETVRTAKKVEIDSMECGRPKITLQRIFQSAGSDSAKTREKRIVGGEDSTLHSFPWQVSLWTNKHHHTCGGSIISSNWIITAAHCTHPYPSPQNWTAYAGANTITEMHLKANETQEVQLTDVVTHPEFDETTYENDVALMRLERHLWMSEKVAPICLPTTDEETDVGEECLISGWGALTEGGSMPKELQKATVGIIDLLVCNAEDWLMGLVSKAMICAGTESGYMDACQGDSGGPLSCLRESTGQFYLSGLVSWGIGCGVPKMPGVYTDVAKYKSWIVQTIHSVELRYS